MVRLRSVDPGLRLVSRGVCGDVHEQAIVAIHVHQTRLDVTQREWLHISNGCETQEKLWYGKSPRRVYIPPRFILTPCPFQNDRSENSGAFEAQNLCNPNPDTIGFIMLCSAEFDFPSNYSTNLQIRKRVRMLWRIYDRAYFAIRTA